MLPVAFVVTLLISAWVLASARRRSFPLPIVILWTLGTLLFPLIILPLYLIVRSHRRRREKEREHEAGDSENQADESRAPLRFRRTLPLAYLVLMLAGGALYYYKDWMSVDAHLARANQARLTDDKERVIKEYREALKLEDNAHTHNLLGKDLAAASRWDEALAEFRTAQSMGEPDDELPYNIAEALDKLHRGREAASEYEIFLRSALCTQTMPDNRCPIAQQRLSELAKKKTP